MEDIFVSWDYLLWIVHRFVWVYDFHEYQIHLKLEFRWTDVDRNEIYKTAFVRPHMLKPLEILQAGR